MFLIIASRLIVVEILAHLLDSTWGQVNRKLYHLVPNTKRSEAGKQQIYGKCLLFVDRHIVREKSITKILFPELALL